MILFNSAERAGVGFATAAGTLGGGGGAAGAGGGGGGPDMSQIFNSFECLCEHERQP